LENLSNVWLLWNLTFIKKIRSLLKSSSRILIQSMITLKAIIINIKLCSQALVRIKQSYLLRGSYWSRIDPLLNFNTMIDVILKGILKACSVQVSWIRLLNTSLILLALALVIDPLNTYDESYSVVCWLSSGIKTYRKVCSQIIYIRIVLHNYLWTGSCPHNRST
jgi:hypothetical protein